jgi:hypothetical protein
LSDKGKRAGGTAVREKNPYPLRWMVPLTIVTAVIAGAAGLCLAVSAALRRLVAGRQQDEVHPGEPPVSTLFRPADERRDG